MKNEEKRPITDTFHDVYNDVLTYCKSIPNKHAIEYLENRCLKLEYLQDLNIQTFDTYDHMLIVGKVLTLENSGKLPLLFLHSSLKKISELNN